MLSMLYLSFPGRQIKCQYTDFTEYLYTRILISVSNRYFNKKVIFDELKSFKFPGCHFSYMIFHSFLTTMFYGILFQF